MSLPPNIYDIEVPPWDRRNSNYPFVFCVNFPHDLQDLFWFHLVKYILPTWILPTLREKNQRKRAANFTQSDWQVWKIGTGVLRSFSKNRENFFSYFLALLSFFIFSSFFFLFFSVFAVEIEKQIWLKMYFAMKGREILGVEVKFFWHIDKNWQDLQLRCFLKAMRACACVYCCSYFSVQTLWQPEAVWSRISSFKEYSFNQYLYDYILH